MSEELVDGEDFVLLKRGLYYRPNNNGYTGLKCEAGLYRAADAMPESGVTAMPFADAPYFAPACWEETKIAHLQNRIAQLEAERDAAKEALKIANEPYWFYYGDDYSSDQCRDSIYECIGEDFEWDNRPEGDHVLLISGARPVPDIWVALHYYTEAEKDAQNSDDEYTFTEHSSKEEAEAAIRALKDTYHD